ncbi:hypothetical protein BKA66DRAFT_554539 [Pyrenochaeta sp. MPI-SDFR-AT-0127]|nr:hypothetical protein BKA66DRAFT_554539 [Pyrenochaeta sp. MPI-SDFR-AT-0127]
MFHETDTDDNQSDTEQLDIANIEVDETRSDIDLSEVEVYDITSENELYEVETENEVDVDDFRVEAKSHETQDIDLGPIENELDQVAPEDDSDTEGMEIGSKPQETQEIDVSTRENELHEPDANTRTSSRLHHIDVQATEVGLRGIDIDAINIIDQSDDTQAANELHEIGAIDDWLNGLGVEDGNARFPAARTEDKLKDPGTKSCDEDNFDIDEGTDDRHSSVHKAKDVDQDEADRTSADERKSVQNNVDRDGDQSQGKINAAHDEHSGIADYSAMTKANGELDNFGDIQTFNLPVTEDVTTLIEACSSQPLVLTFFGCETSLEAQRKIGLFALNNFLEENQCWE